MIGSDILLFLDISGGELLIILMAVFLIFGPKKMPEMARKIGRAINEVKKASGDITREFREETNSITRELVETRESLRNESDKIKADLNQTRLKVEQDLEIKATTLKTASPPSLSPTDLVNDNKTTKEERPSE